MKNIYLKIIAVLIFIVSANSILAQNKFNPILPVFNIDGDAQYRIEAKSVDGSIFNIQFTVSDIKSIKDPVTFTLTPFTSDSFKKELTKALTEIGVADIKKLNDSFESLYQMYFSAIISASENIGENVVAGVISINNNADILRSDNNIKRKIKADLSEYKASSYKKRNSKDANVDQKIRWGFMGKNPNTNGFTFFRSAKFCSENCDEEESWNLRHEEKEKLRKNDAKTQKEKIQKLIDPLIDSMNTEIRDYIKVMGKIQNNRNNLILNNKLLKEKTDAKITKDSILSKLNDEKLSLENGEIIRTGKGIDTIVFKTFLKEQNLSGIKLNELDDLQNLVLEDNYVNLTEILFDTIKKLNIRRDDIVAEKEKKGAKKDSLDIRLGFVDGKLFELNNLKYRLNELASLFDERKQLDDTIKNNDISGLTADITSTNADIDTLNQNLEAEQKEAKDHVEKAKSDYYHIVKLKQKLPEQPFKIIEVDIEFRHGFIEQMKVWGKIDIQVLEKIPDEVKTDENFKFLNKENRMKEERILLYNHTPIGFSSNYDYKRLNKRFLISYPRWVNGKKIIYELRLTDVLPDFDYKLAPGRRDFSPANSVIKFEKEGKRSQPVYKEQTSKLFAAKIYSDMLGFSKESPNGIIQAEVEKRLNLFTFRARKTGWLNMGWFSYIKPMLVISKLEENNKGLILDYRDDFKQNISEPEKYASTLDLFQHEIFSIGNELNLIVFDSRPFKSTIFIDWGFQYGQTQVIDSLWYYDNGTITKPNGTVENWHKNIDTYRIFPKLRYTVYPDERYSFSATYSYNFYYARTNDFTQVANKEYFDYTGERSSYWNQFNSVELQAKIKFDKTNTGNWFVRYRYNWQRNFWNTGYSQFQLGYKMYIMTHAKEIQSKVQ